MRFDVITIFPKIFDSYLNESLLKRAQKKGLVSVAAHDLRNFAAGRHRKVDDRPYGGGPGMVLKVEPIYRAVSSIKYQVSRGRPSKRRVILFSTHGKKLDAKISKRLATYDQLILICGRYEGVDERVARYIADEEISIGDYVLNGGELAAMVLIESVSRFLPGFLGKKESLEEIKGSYPTYTRPSEFVLPKKRRDANLFSRPLRRSYSEASAPATWKVPGVLRSGNHKKIKEHRMNQIGQIGRISRIRRISRK